MAEPRIVCPKCGHRFPISEALSAEIEDSVRREMERETRSRVRAVKQEYSKRLASDLLRAQREARREAKEASSAELVELRKVAARAEEKQREARRHFERKLAEERSKLGKDAEIEAKKTFGEQIAVMKKELKARDEQLRGAELRDRKVKERERLIEAKERDIEKKLEREVESARRRAREEVIKEVEEDQELRQARQDKMIAELRKQLSDTRVKLEQISTQTQGEVYELELEKILRHAFPEDEIKPVRAGKLGADLHQTVCSPSGQPCGAILWEAKNTKNWSNTWTTKLKSDQRRAKAEVAVLVSSVLPKGFKGHFGQIAGVWLSDFSTALGLAAALRANMFDVATMKLALEGKAEKTEMVYQYLMSTEFRQRVEAVLEAFMAMKDDLEQERKTAETRWAKREKQIQIVFQNVSGMVGDIQAIAPAFPQIKRLELPAPSQV